MQSAISLIEKELKDLDILEGSDAWNAIYEQATGAYDVLTKKELKKYVSDLSEGFSFDQKVF